jgi:hypothetical protein
VKPAIAKMALLGGLATATVGMALVTVGVAVGGLFFPGIYLLAAGLLATAVGAVMHVARRAP